MMASSQVPMVINFLSIKAATPAVVTTRSLGCTIFTTTSPAAVTSRFPNSYHQVRNFARSGRPSSSKRIRRGGTNNNSTTATAAVGGGGGGNNNGIITNNPHPRHQTKNILIIGSQGELGKTLVSHFGKQMNWNVVGADVIDPTSDVVMNSLQTKGMASYIPLPMDGSIADLSVALYRGVDAYLQEDDSSTGATLDAIVCASGGWMGDIDKYTHQQSIIENELLEDVDPDEDYIRESSMVCDRMMRVNYYPVVAGSMIGQQFLNGGSSSHNNNGLFVIIGASAALSPTPGMMGYGPAKAASHHYLQSYGPSVTEENGSTSVGILPLMLDTPANRAMLGGNDDDGDDRYSKMVKPIHIANEIGEWIKNPHLRPHSGSLVKVIAKNRKDGSGGAAFHLVR